MKGIFTVSKKGKRIAIIGHFGGNENFLDGQTIKTKVFYEELSRVEGLHIKKVDTYYKNHNVIKLLWDLCLSMVTCRHFVVLVAGNGMRTMFPILYFCSRFLKKRVHHCVIGASLANRVVAYGNFKKYLNSFAVNWCETTGLVQALHNLGVTNAQLLYNCKRLEPVAAQELSVQTEKPFKLCMFSRVMKEKGVEDAVNAVKAINEKYGETAYVLDIYGQVDPEQKAWFAGLERQFPEYVRYCGQVPFDKSVAVLKSYFALLFPTRYFTEGVPGTIIDAYAAGLPVIASRWENFDNMIYEDTGIGYAFDRPEELVGVLDGILQAPTVITDKKQKCVERYKAFSPDAVIKQMLDKMT